jgi:arginine deiminase
MLEGARIFGGFSLSPFLAQRVFEAVHEITVEHLDTLLSHVDDDDCAVCREARAKEEAHDAAQQDRAGRERTA